MLTFTIKDFAGCAKATLQCAPIALIAGLNEAGKSSIAQACAAVLTNTTTMRHVKKKKDQGALVRDGATEAVAYAGCPTGSAQLLWPGGRYTADGARPPEATQIAAGMIDVLQMTPEDRAATLIELLAAEVTRADYDAALPGLPNADGLWKIITEKGWDAAHTRVAQRITEQRGAWEQVTNENYGSQKAVGWRPVTLKPESEELGEGGLILAVQGAKQRLDHAKAAGAAERERRRQLKVTADTLPETESRLEQAIKDEEAARVANHTAVGLRQQLPGLGQVGQINLQQSECPHCGKPVIMLDGRAARPEAAAHISIEERTRRQAAIAEHDRAVKSSAETLANAQRLVGEAQLAKRQAEEAAQSLAEAERTPIEDHHEADAGAAQHAVDWAARQLELFKIREQAAEIQTAIEMLQKAADATAPSGLRQTKLQEKLAPFNAQLREFCQILERPPLQIMSDMTVMFGDKPVEAHSDSRRWRARVALQLAIAKMDGSACVIIDAADILDAPSRGQLLRMVLAAQIPAIICMTAWDKSLVPDLAAHGVGHTYWMEDGVLRPLPAGEAAAQPAA